MQIGEFGHHPVASERFQVDVTIPAQDIQLHWRRCNMLANYLAEYSAYQFQEREWAENMISTIVNEFLEAIVVLAPPETALRVRCLQLPQNLQIEIEHDVQPDLIDLYAHLFQELNSPRLDELYYELLTAHQRLPISFNQFGIVMLAHDFQAQIAADLSFANHHVFVRVAVPLSNIAP